MDPENYSSFFSQHSGTSFFGLLMGAVMEAGGQDPLCVASANKMRKGLWARLSLPVLNDGATNVERG